MLDFGVTTTCAIPLALVTKVVASKALRPKIELTLTTAPAPTALPVEFKTWIVRVAGAAALMLALLEVIVIDGMSANNCTTAEL